METTGPFSNSKENSDKFFGGSISMVYSVYLSHTTVGSEKAGGSALDLPLEWFESSSQEGICEITSRGRRIRSGEKVQGFTINLD